MVKPLVSETILYLNILHITTDEASNRTDVVFRNNTKQSKIAVRGGECRSWLTHCATRREVLGPIPGVLLGNYEVTQYFRSHSVALGSTQSLNRNV